MNFLAYIPIINKLIDLLSKYMDKYFIDKQDVLIVLDKLSKSKPADLPQSFITLYSEVSNEYIDNREGFSSLKYADLLKVCADLKSDKDAVYIDKFEKAILTFTDCRLKQYIEDRNINNVDNRFISQISMESLGEVKHNYSDYNKKVSLSMLSESSYIVEFQEFNNSFKSDVERIAKDKFNAKQFNPYFTLNDSGDYVWQCDGYSHISSTDDILKRLFNATLSNTSLEPNGQIQLKGSIGNYYYDYYINPIFNNAKDKKVVFDIRNVSILYSGVISAIIIMFKILRKSYGVCQVEVLTLPGEQYETALLATKGERDLVVDYEY